MTIELLLNPESEQNMLERERERENSVFVYCNKQAGAEMQWVRYIAAHYWLHPSFGGVG